jgi:hypothetical protein
MPTISPPPELTAWWPIITFILGGAAAAGWSMWSGERQRARERREREDALLAAFYGEITALRKGLHRRLDRALAAARDGRDLINYETGLSRPIFQANSSEIGRLPYAELVWQIVTLCADLDEIDHQARAMSQNRERWAGNGRGFLPYHLRDLGSCLHLAVLIGMRLRALTQTRMQAERYDVVTEKLDEEESDLAARARGTAEQLIRDRARLAGSIGISGLGTDATDDEGSRRA